ncbi:MAG: mucoidy inhibitor MuiA family protein [Spirochaetota bacterium]
MNTKLISLCIGILAISVIPAAGKTESVVDSKIDRVMVYHDRAHVTRTARLSSGGGIVDAVFTSLPGIISDESVRARVLTPASAKILDLEVRSVAEEKAADPKAQVLETKLRELQEEKARIDANLRMISVEDEYLAGVRKSFLAAFAVRGKGDELSSARPSVQEIDSLLKYFTTRNMSNALLLIREQKAQQSVASRIAVVQHDLSKLESGAGRATKTARVTVETAGASVVMLELSYHIASVAWNPGYDIRVLLDEKKTEFTGYGVVSQSSGEDWIDATIGFSTAQPSVRGTLPDLVPVYAIPPDRIPQNRGLVVSGKKYATQQEANRSLLDNVTVGQSRSSDALSETTASGDRRAGSLVFSVPKRADIPSDGSPHRTSISRESFPVHFEYLSIPKLSPYAFLQALGSNTLTTPILKGDLNIFLGNDFVGSSSTGNILPGEDFELSLSVNENIRVTRTLEERDEKTSGFLGNQTRASYSFLIKVENYTGSAIVMNLLDQIPVSGSEDVVVEGITFSREPSFRNKQGIIKWHFPMQSKETATISFSFTVIGPKEKGVAFFRTTLPPSVYLQQLMDSVVRKAPMQMDESDYRPEKSAAPSMRQKMY